MFDLQMRSDITDYWNKRADSYSESNASELNGRGFSVWRSVLQNEISAHFPDRLPGDLRALDIGTGPGFMGITLAGLGLIVTGADSASEMLINARRNADNASVSMRFVQTDAQSPDFADESFDIIVCRNLTWDLEDPESAYRAWHRILKPSGLLLIFDANWYRYLYDDEVKRQYDADRRRVKELNLIDYNHTSKNCKVDFGVIEEIAKNLPLSRKLRPGWDIEALKRAGFSRVSADSEIWKTVWTDEEKINFSSTPLFMVRGVKKL